MNLLMKTATEQEVELLREMFMKIDTDGTGLIHASELRDIILQQHGKVSESQINDIIQELDYIENNKINYTEFLAATIDVKTFLSESRLKAVFNKFDTDSTGKITKENIFLAMQKLGRSVPKQDINEILNEHD